MKCGMPHLDIGNFSKLSATMPKVVQTGDKGDQFGGVVLGKGQSKAG